MYKVTFESKRVMEVKAPNSRNASEVAGYFVMAYGKVVKVEKA